MNDLEKRSFYSFLGLYIVSSFLFISFVGYWYYIAQKNALENETYYKLVHIADLMSGEIIMAHMHSRKMKTITLPEKVKLALIDTEGKVVYGALIDSDIQIKPGYFKQKGYSILISDAPREHLNIRYAVVQTNMLSAQIQALKNVVWKMVITILLLIIFVAWVLSKLFMRPVHLRVKQIERFINDVTHELNTPITSLSMSTKLALQKGECTEKILNNISISTKQLYDIYRSLTYLNFSNKKETAEALELKETLEKNVAYYGALAEMKRITFDVKLEPLMFAIPEAQATLLFGNLIGNAIKYSSPNSQIEIVLKDNILTIKDEGIGIEETQQKKIFEKFKRGTEYSGGFGVGLSIVKSICNEYGITVSFASKSGKGTTFKLEF
ncbi:MAG TPA: HAMP domain-containing histidine kinase [Epsilonproteobacteria bacterium]|nr:HAMP domain-containing histidine kinase [Campylobacterota bacterium]